MTQDQLLLGIMIALLWYFFSLWGVKKFLKPKPKNANILAVISTVIMTPCIYVVTIMILFSITTYVPTKKFDREKWDEEVERLEMAKYIIKSDMLIGKSKEEVVDILGNDYYDYGSTDSIAYDLVDGSGLFGIDPDNLRIYFKENKVIDVKQFRE